MNFVDAWEWNGTLGISQKKILPIYQRFHPNLLGRPNLEVYLSQIENEAFKIPKVQLEYSNFSKLEWEVIRSVAVVRCIVIKKAD